MSDDLVEMARLAQHDERMATGALYGDLADRIEELETKLARVKEAFRINMMDALPYYTHEMFDKDYAKITGEADE